MPAAPVPLPAKGNRQEPAGFLPEALYRGRGRINQTVGKLKRLKRGGSGLRRRP
jgi:hypothetical protein